MKTITELPAIPEGWEWTRNRSGSWDPMNGPLLAAMRHMAKTGLHREPVTGTPPAGSIVWDARSIEYVLYQPEAV